MIERSHVEGHRQGLKGRSAASGTRRVSSVDDAFDAWAKWTIIFINELDDERYVGQRLVVLNSEDKSQSHRRVHGWNRPNVNGVPSATMNIELPALYTGGICEHCCRRFHVAQCNT